MDFVLDIADKLVFDHVYAFICLKELGSLNVWDKAHIVRQFLTLFLITWYETTQSECLFFFRH